MDFSRLDIPYTLINWTIGEIMPYQDSYRLNTILIFLANL